MAATANAAQLLLDGTSPRIVPVALPTNITADWTTNVTGTGKPANYATVNRVTRAGTAPASPLDGDIWIDTSVNPNVIKTRISGAWQIGASYTTNTNQLTDGAGLGTSALWASVIGTGKPSNYADVTTTILGASGTSIVMTSSNLFTSASGTSGVFIGSAGIFGKASGTTTFSIDGTTGAAYFYGNITGGANITITGRAQFTGQGETVGGFNWAATFGVGLSNASQKRGVYAIGYRAIAGETPGGAYESSSVAVQGSTTTGVAVKGIATASGGAGLVGVGNSGALALQLFGPMATNDTTMVSNLNAELCNGSKIGAVSTGAATATQTLTNKPGSASSNSWLKITVSGTDYYLPAWT